MVHYQWMCRNGEIYDRIEGGLVLRGKDVFRSKIEVTNGYGKEGYSSRGKTPIQPKVERPMGHSQKE